MELTPMMRQYKEAKEQHPDEILFFRLGDFYEMFFDDALLVSKELGLTLTSRSGDTEKSPMCGVPHHSADGYIEKLIKRGYKVAIAEQTSDPKAPGLTKRSVVKIVTPGTIMTDDALSADNNYIALLAEGDGTVSLAGADISTGECFYECFTGDGRQDATFAALYRVSPSEILVMDGASFESSVKSFAAKKMWRCSFTRSSPVPDPDEILRRHFSESDIPKDPTAKEAVAALLKYLHDTAMTDLSHINSLARLDGGNTLELDAYTLKNLEITRNIRDGDSRNTLLSVIDFTKTAMGRRLLKRWLEAPLRSTVKINRRLDAVEELWKNFSMRQRLTESLKGVYDFERLLSRIETGAASPRDIVALRLSLERLPAIRESVSSAKSRLLRKSFEEISTHESLLGFLSRAIADDPPPTMREGGVIREGYSKELDDYRSLSHDSKKTLQGIEEREREKTGIKSLKIGYNKVFGYYIEVRNSAKAQVPSHYIRKQTLANAERFITGELKEFETRILGAEEKSLVIESAIFQEVRARVAEEIASVQKTARALAAADVFAALAECASSYQYVRPLLSDDGVIKITDGRHPIVERILDRELFVPNDTVLSHEEREILIITGPNMAGKSTYMRQTALITLMAQAGSFVPARAARISPVDRIFTRIGASDDLASGESTFMVEMNETGDILRNATRDSLVLLDEVGRGTSTFDGMSIARASLEYIRDNIHAKTMFATHYHELTDMEGDTVKNCCIAVKEKGRDVVFLRRIINGAADKSYGIHVARLAGLPKPVTSRAEEILKGLESGGGKRAVDGKKEERDDMVSLFSSSLSDELLSLDVMTMTPVEALSKLYELQQQAKEEAGRN